MPITTTITHDMAVCLPAGSHARVSGVGTHQQVSPTPGAGKLRPPRHQNGVEKVEMSCSQRRRTLPEVLSETLLRLTHKNRYQRKHLTKLTGASTKTISNWLAGETAPSAEHLIALMTEFDEVFEVICELSGRKSPPNLSPAECEAIARALSKLTGAPSAEVSPD